jgi:hypothetical protein
MSKIALSGDASGTGTFTIASPNSNSNFTLTLPAATGTVVVSGTTPSLNGITFPATQVASADANTLDDYEEGTWTPVDGSGASLSFTNTSGNCIYTKIGKTVFASFRVTYPSTANGSFAYIGGLPFATANTTVNVFPVCFAEQNYVAGTTGNISTNDTKFLILTVSGGAISIATNANVSGKDFRGVAIYQTA